MVSAHYTLNDGDEALEVSVTYSNRHDESVAFEPIDAVRADNTFDKGLIEGERGAPEHFWAYDKWFGQAYAVTAGEIYSRDQQQKVSIVPRRRLDRRTNEHIALQDRR